MKLIRHIEKVNLLKSSKEKQANGTYIDTFKGISSYPIVKKNLRDEISATIYGSNINKMYSISSPLGDLEEYLLSKVNNKEDNVSLYCIEYKNSKYKITSVTETDIIIDRI